VDDPEAWRWIWMGAAALFLVGEIAVAGSFFLLPFGLGAIVACIAAFAGASVGLQWLLFVAVSAIASAGLIPLRRRLDQAEPQDGIGSRRLLNQPAVVEVTIEAGPHGSGFVRIGREQWRAESVDGQEIGEGARVRVVDVRGTGVVVRLESNEGARS
jgi:membrane protein implicated in regulation of membrane protease activity